MDINQLKDKTREYAFGYIYGRKLLNENKSINVIENIISEAKEKNNEIASGLEDGVYSVLTENVENYTNVNEVADPVIKKMLVEYEHHSEVNPWMQLQFINSNLPHNDELVKKAEEIYRALEDGKIDEPTAKQRLGNIVMLVQNKLWGDNPQQEEHTENINEDNFDNEDFEEYAECSWCGEEYPMSELHREKDLGLLCNQCIRAIESREGDLDFIDDYE